MRWYWSLIILPLLLSIVIGLYLNYSSTFNPILYIRADLGYWFVFGGITLTFVTAVIIAFWELSEKVKITRIETILKASEDRRRFLQRLDHEFKNPLTAILAGLANLGNGGSSENRTTNHETLISVEAEVRRLSRLVADLRKLSDLEIRPIELSPVDIGDLLYEAHALAKEFPGAEERHINLSIPQAPWPLPEVAADRDLLFLAIHNLLSNAVKFSIPGDRIEIRAFEDNQSVVIEVADTGPGIPENETPYIWEELYRGVEARGIPGSGLGLALVRAIVQRHNGQASLRSRVGQGTVVTLRLPITHISKKL